MILGEHEKLQFEKFRELAIAKLSESLDKAKADGCGLYFRVDLEMNLGGISADFKTEFNQKSQMFW